MDESAFTSAIIGANSKRPTSLEPVSELSKSGGTSPTPVSANSRSPRRGHGRSTSTVPDAVIARKSRTRTAAGPLSPSLSSQPAVGILQSTTPSSQSSGLGSFWKRASVLYESVKANVGEKIATAANQASININTNANKSQGSALLSSMLNSVAAAASSNIPKDDATEASQAESSFVELDLSSLSFTPYQREILIQSNDMSSERAEFDSLFLSILSLLTLIAHTLSHSVGGYLTPNIFFPRQAFYSPSLRLSAMTQKIECLAKFSVLLTELIEELDASKSDFDRQTSVWQRTVSEMDKLQNELAFSLTAIQETQTTNINTSATTSTGTSSWTDGLTDDQQQSAESDPVDDTLNTVSATAEKLTDRFKSLGYSLVKSAHRISKQVMTEKMTTALADAYVSHLTTVNNECEQLSIHYIQYRHLQLPPMPTDTGSDSDSATVINQCYHKFVHFVKDVLLVFLIQDLSIALTKYSKEQQAALLHEPYMPLFRQREEHESGDDYQQQSSIGASVGATDVPSAING